MTYTTFRVAATLLAMLTTITVPATARAQSATTGAKPSTAALRANGTQPTGSDRMRGFMLGVHSIAAPGLTLTGGEIDGSFITQFGAGAGVTVGYGITRLFSAVCNCSVTTCLWRMARSDRIPIVATSASA